MLDRLRRKVNWWLYIWLNVEIHRWGIDFTNDYPAMHGAYFGRTRRWLCRRRGHVWPHEASWKDYCLRCRAAPSTPKKIWTIEGPFAPGEMPLEMQKQWDDLKQTGIGPGHPDF